ncbi:MAG: hypothetical protein ACTHNW_08140 [Mucilaginibacter sp.]
MAATTKNTVKKPTAKKQFKDEFIDDQDTGHIDATLDDHDPAYDEHIADNIDDNDDASEDTDNYDDHDEHRNNRK